MTPHQVAAVAALGGLAALLGLVLVIALALGVYQLLDRLVEAHSAWRAHKRQQQDEQQDDLAVCQAIHDLPTRHPTDN